MSLSAKMLQCGKTRIPFVVGTYSYELSVSSSAPIATIASGFTIEQDDLILHFLTAHDYESRTIVSAPPGYTLLDTADTSGSGGWATHAGLCYKIASGGEVNSGAWTLSAGASLNQSGSATTVVLRYPQAAFNLATTETQLNTFALRLEAESYTGAVAIVRFANSTIGAYGDTAPPLVTAVEGDSTTVETYWGGAGKSFITVSSTTLDVSSVSAQTLTDVDMTTTIPDESNIHNVSFSVALTF